MGTGQTHFAKQLSAFKDMNAEAVDLPGHGYSTEKTDTADIDQPDIY